MLLTILGAAFALISGVAAAAAWITQYDQRLRLETMEQRVQSLQGTMGNLKQTVRSDAQKILREEMESQGMEPAGGQDMGAALMQMMLAQNLQVPQEPERQSQNGRSQPKPGMMGSGGSPSES